MALRPVTFHFNDDLSDEEHIGFIAEEVFGIDPRLVQLNQDGLPDALRLGEFLPLIVKSIQELNLKIENLGLGSTTSTSTSTVTVADGSGIIDTLLYAGMRLFQDSVKFVEVVAERIITNEIRTKTIQITDEDTGEEYCVHMKSGALVSTLGECSGNITPTAPQPSSPDSAPPSQDASEGQSEVTPDEETSEGEAELPIP